VTPIAAPGPLALVRLLQLASPTLPVGAFAYSQGLEWVVAAGSVHDAATAQAWIGDLLELVVAPGEAAVAWRLLRAAAVGDDDAFVHWNAWFRASRETAELRAETEQMGGSLARLAADLGVLDAGGERCVAAARPITLPAAYAVAARGFDLAPETALVAYVWAWLENQTMAALKAVPLGQVAGQRLLLALGARVPAAVAVACAITDDEITTFAPGFALASAHHETQYTRLFRS
jgi:urease accessory protein